MTVSVSTYMSMLKSAKKAKEEGKASFEYFIKAATGSEGYKLTSRGIECKENVSGLSLIFLCEALIKMKESEKKNEMILVVKSHLSGLMKMRTSTSLPLCIVAEEEGVMFEGEGMALRFLNALIILESLLISKLKGDEAYLKEVWGMYSSMDLIVYLELPALLNHILDEREREGYAEAIESEDKKSKYYEERRTAKDLVRATVRKPVVEVKSASNIPMIVMGVIFFLFYTSVVIKVSQQVREYEF